MMHRRRNRFETIKKDLYNQWLIFKRMPLLLLYMGGILGSMSIMLYLVGYIVMVIIGGK